MMKLIWGKRKGIQKRKLIDACEININAVFEKNMWHQKIDTFWRVVNDEVHQLLLKSLERFKLFKKKFYQEYLSWMTDKEQGDQTKSSAKNTLKKGIWIWYWLLYLQSHQLTDHVIE